MWSRACHVLLVPFAVVGVSPFESKRKPRSALRGTALEPLFVTVFCIGCTPPCNTLRFFNTRDRNLHTRDTDSWSCAAHQPSACRSPRAAVVRTHLQDYRDLDYSTHVSSRSHRLSPGRCSLSPPRVVTRVVQQRRRTHYTCTRIRVRPQTEVTWRLHVRPLASARAPMRSPKISS